MFHFLTQRVTTREDVQRGRINRGGEWAVAVFGEHSRLREPYVLAVVYVRVNLRQMTFGVCEPPRTLRKEDLSAKDAGDLLQHLTA